MEAQVMLLRESTPAAELAARAVSSVMEGEVDPITAHINISRMEAAIKLFKENTDVRDITPVSYTHLCKLGDGCDVSKSLFISASSHTVSYWGEDVIQIGCKRCTISEWQKHFRKIGEAEGYSPEQMEEYKGYIDLIATMHKTWKVGAAD